MVVVKETKPIIISFNLYTGVRWPLQAARCAVSAYNIRHYGVFYCFFFRRGGLKNQDIFPRGNTLFGRTCAEKNCARQHVRASFPARKELCAILGGNILYVCVYIYIFVCA